MAEPKKNLFPAEGRGVLAIRDREHDGISIKPYTHQDLTGLYGVSWLTLQRWLKRYEDEVGKKNGHFYTSKQVEIIFNLIGWPPGK